MSDAGLLLLLHADDAFIGAMSMISSGANMLQAFAPLLLERFPKDEKRIAQAREILRFAEEQFIPSRRKRISSR